MHHNLLSLSFSVIAVFALAGCGEQPEARSADEPKSNAPVRILNTQSATGITVRITSTTKDEDIRALLISHTPIGTSATNVLRFVVDELRAVDGASSYYKYVDALEANRTRRIGVVRVDPARPAILPEGSKWEQPHEIYAVLGGYHDGRLPCRVAANWKFDEGDNLAELRIVRDHSP
jgi:hypothetical protein